MTTDSTSSARPVQAVPLNQALIKAALPSHSRALVNTLTVLPSVNSTNSYLLEQAVNLHAASVCLAEQQSSGRGRRGREWLSTPNRNLMMSLSWGFAKWPETITGLGLAVALIVTERLRLNFDIDVKIKWPNDIMIADCKLGGILIDVAGDANGACNVVIGIGINVDQADWQQGHLSPTAVTGRGGSEAPAANYQWQDLKGLGVRVDRNRLASELVADLVEMLRRFEAHGFAPLTDRWNRLSSYANRQICVYTQSAKLEGAMLGVDQSGALLMIDGNRQQHRISDSNVTIRVVP